MVEVLLVVVVLLMLDEKLQRFKSWRHLKNRLFERFQ